MRDVTYLICVFYDREKRDFSIMDESLRIDSENIYTS